MRVLFTYMNIHEGTIVSWGHYCDLVIHADKQLGKLRPICPERRRGARLSKPPPQNT